MNENMAAEVADEMIGPEIDTAKTLAAKNTAARITVAKTTEVATKTAIATEVRTMAEVVAAVATGVVAANVTDDIARIQLIRRLNQ